MEKPGIEPATLVYKPLFVAVFLGYNQYWPGGFMVFVVLCPGAPEGSPAVVLDLKRLRRRRHNLKSHQTDWEKSGIEPATPGLQDIGLQAISNHCI